MDEAVMYGVAVALLMLGVPLWHSMGECRKGRLVRVHLCRWWLVCGFMVMFSLVVAVIFGLAGFVIQNSPPPKAARLSADCKILSKDVDIRSAKVCEVGHTVHKSRGWKSPNGPSKFLCSLDYYWTTVLKVEYRPHASESVVRAGAEFPGEALPSNCRPDFGVVWSIKENLMINKTYACQYGLRNLKMVDILIDSAHIASNCSIDEPSSSDLVWQFWYLLIHSENSILSSSGRAGELFSRAAAAVGLGICYSMIVTGFTRTVCLVHFRLDQGEYTDLDVVYFEARIQLAILFTASLFGVFWFSSRFAVENVDVDHFLETLYKRNGFVDPGQ